MSGPPIDLDADLNMEDDDGLNWTLLDERQTVERSRVFPGAVLRAGRPGGWSWVVIETVEDTGFVNFRQVDAPPV